MLSNKNKFIFIGIEGVLSNPNNEEEKEDSFIEIENKKYPDIVFEEKSVNILNDLWTKNNFELIVTSKVRCFGIFYLETLFRKNKVFSNIAGIISMMEKEKGDLIVDYINDFNITDYLVVEKWPLKIAKSIDPIKILHINNNENEYCIRDKHIDRLKSFLKNT